MHFTLRQLEIFTSVLRHGRIRSAAAAIHLSEAAVSQALAELADGLGTSLFERRGRQLVPTAAARQLDVLSAEPLAALQQIPTHLAADKHAELAGHLRLAASSTIARYILPRALADLRRRHPQLEIELIADNTAGVERRVAERAADVGFTEGPTGSEAVIAAPWRTDVLRVIAPRDYPVALIDVDRLGEHPWVSREAGSGTRAVFEQALALSGRPVPRAGMVCNDSGALVRAVAGGAGLGCVSRFAARHARERDTIQEIEIRQLALDRPLWRIDARLAAGHQPPIVARALAAIDDWLDAEGH